MESPGRKAANARGGTNLFPRCEQRARLGKNIRLKDRVDVQRGLENAPATLARLFKGENRGKQLLRIADGE